MATAKDFSSAKGHFRLNLISMSRNNSIKPCRWHKDGIGYYLSPYPPQLLVQSSYMVGVEVATKMWCSDLPSRKLYHSAARVVVSRQPPAAVLWDLGYLFSQSYFLPGKPPSKHGTGLDISAQHRTPLMDSLCSECAKTLSDLPCALKLFLPNPASFPPFIFHRYYPPINL